MPKTPGAGRAPRAPPPATPDAARVAPPFAIPALLESAWDGVVVADPDTAGFVWCNERFASLLGCSREQAEQLSVMDIHPPAQLPMILATFREMAADRLRQVRDVPVQRLDGSVFTAHINACWLEHGGRRLLCGFFHDVSGLQAAEHRAHSAARLLEQVFDASPLLMAHLDLDFNFVRVNPAYARADGRPADFFPGRNHFDLYPDASNAAIFRQVRDRGAPHVSRAKPFTYAQAPERGVTHWDWTLDRVHDADNRPVGLLLILEDVSERVRQIEALERERQELQAKKRSLNAAQRLAGMCSWDGDHPDGRLLWSNEAARLFETEAGALPDTLEGLLAWVHPGDRERVAAVRAAAFAQGTSYSLRHRLLLPSGRSKPVQEVGAISTAAEQARRHITGTLQDIGPQIEAERALAAAQAYFRQIFEHNPEAVLLLDREALITDINPAGLQLLEADQPEAVLGRNLCDLVAAESRAALAGVCAAVRAGGREVFELQLTGLHGRPRHAEAHTAPLAGGETVLAVLRDTTSAHQAQAKIRQSKDLLQTVVDSTPDWIYVKDRRHRFLLVNQAFAAAFGMEPQQMVGRPDLDFWPLAVCEGNPAAGIRGLHDDDREVLAGRVLRNPSDPASLADGRLRVFDTYKGPLRDAAGQVYAVLCYARDVSEQRHAEDRIRQLNQNLEQTVALRTRQLQRQQELTDAILDTAGALVVVLDRQGRIVRFNRACELASGYRSAEITGRPLFDDLLLPGEREGVQAVFRRLLEDEASNTHVNHWRARDGSARLIEWSNTRLCDAEGKVDYVIGTGMDITDRRAAERELLAAKEDAERANQAKSELLARMSHELRTPMNAILGFGQLLELEASSAGQRDSVTEILKAGRHLQELIDELLDLSRIESGRLPVAINALDPDTVLQDAVHLSQAAIEHHGVSLHLRRAMPAGMQVLADSTRLRQVLINLLTNAAKFNREGGSILLACEATGPERLRFAVTDTGAGLLPEQLARLFVPFERLGAEQRGIEGSGIGLALSRRLVELMSGRMGADSTPGEGTTLWFELPAMRPEDGTGAVDEPAAASPSPRAVILYIEDNLANQRLVMRIFERHPAALLITASSGELGLEQARRHRPDLILLDIHLPGINGYETLARLRALPGLEGVPVLALTADAMPQEVQRGLEAGFHAYLTKPVDIKQLLQAIDEALARPLS